MGLIASAWQRYLDGLTSIEKPTKYVLPGYIVQAITNSLYLDLQMARRTQSLASLCGKVLSEVI